ncbi:MAG: beta-N-acetylhexosaminidase [Desulfobacteraceae bacterium]|nr:beta-N-acetylhexosaminidase [Desulfobacteraceae bacterium]
MDQYQFTPETLAGQRLMFGFDGTMLNDDLKFLIKHLNACGIILFKRNIQTPSQVKDLCGSAQRYAALCGLPPLFIAVDQEGGTVARLKEGFTVFPGNPHIQTIEDAKNFSQITADELKSVGINMNFAPVLDVVPDKVDSIMKKRAFEGGPGTVAKLGSCVINHLQKNKIMAVAKHFPGIGRTVKDSHFHLPVLNIDYKTLKKTDLVPFMAAVKEDVTGIMLSHISYPSLDADFQASLSEKIVQSVLRRDLGYKGIIMTDDLDMEAIQTDINTCMFQMLWAGIDVALICHKGPAIEKAYNEICRLIQENESLMEMGKESMNRILNYKKEYLG